MKDGMLEDTATSAVKGWRDGVVHRIKATRDTMKENGFKHYVAQAVVKIGELSHNNFAVDMAKFNIGLAMILFTILAVGKMASAKFSMLLLFPLLFLGFWGIVGIIGGVIYLIIKLVELTKKLWVEALKWAGRNINRR